MLTYETVVRLADEAVGEMGADFVYNPYGTHDCAYVPSTDERFPFTADDAAAGAAVTGCLVGRILAGAGALTDRIAGYMGNIASLFEMGDVTADAKAVQFLQNVQGYQDDGVAWGEAVASAKLAVEKA